MECCGAWCGHSLRYSLFRIVWCKSIVCPGGGGGTTMQHFTPCNPTTHSGDAPWPTPILTGKTLSARHPAQRRRTPNQRRRCRLLPRQVAAARHQAFRDATTDPAIFREMVNWACWAPPFPSNTVALA